jgi:Flp pilus assembly protein TadD
MKCLSFWFLLGSLITATLRAEETAPAGSLPPLQRPLEQATVFARQATEAMRLGEWKQAAEMWEQVIKLQPDSAAALSNLGAVEMKLNNRDKAKIHLEKAVSLRPNLAATWMTLGLLQLESKNPMLAISHLSRAVHEDPSDARLHNSLAIALKQVGWSNGAELELQRAIDLNPEYSEAHFNLALLYLEQKPPALESARRHYFTARDLGSASDELVDQQFKEAGIVYVPPDPQKPVTNTESETTPGNNKGTPTPDSAPKPVDKSAKPANKPKPKAKS